MSEMSEKARSEGKEKVKRLTGEGKGAVDASGWTEDEYGCGLMNTQKKLGNRPISKQNLATGGKAAHKHAGRKSRDMGGPMSSAGQNYVAQVPAPPQNRFSFTGNQSPLLAAAGMNKGGRMGRAAGGPTDEERIANQREAFGFATGSKAPGQFGGGPRSSAPTPSASAPKKLNRVTQSLLNGPRKRTDGGKAEAPPPVRSPQDEADRAWARAREKGPSPVDTKGDWNKGGRTKRADGGMAEEIEGKRPMGGRMPRASGGSAKKGTTVNIIIAQKPEHQMMPGGAPGGAMPPPKPPMPMPTPGAPPPMGPQGAPAGPMPGGPNMPPPSMQPHAKGGSVYPDMKFSAANGKGRLEKAKKYCG